MGRGTKPDQKWQKAKRQTFCNDVSYIHVKSHIATTTVTIGTVCKWEDLDKTAKKQ